MRSKKTIMYVGQCELVELKDGEKVSYEVHQGIMSTYFATLDGAMKYADWRSNLLERQAPEYLSDYEDSTGYGGS